MKWSDILRHPSTALILGARGTGKSALGYYLLNDLPMKSSYIIGLPESKWSLLPGNITPVMWAEELPEDCVAFIDEASLKYHAYRWRSQDTEVMDALVSISRQRSQTLIFATHTTRKLAAPLLLDMDVLIFKEPSILHSRFDRAEIRDLSKTAKEHFDALPEADRKRWSYVVSDHWEGMMENPLPPFWSEELSRAYQGIEMVRVRETYKGGYFQVSSLDELAKLMRK